MNILSADDLTKSFGATAALQGASMSLGRGEILALMGPSGSGKSTLLHCLAGIFAPDGGTVTFDGRDLSAMSDRVRTRLRRTDFGFVFQFGQLVPELTAVDNIALPLLLAGIRRKNAYARAASWFPRLDLAGLEGRRTGEISGGQAQRVAIGRALVTRPKVVFADEPTGALDSLTGEKVMDLMVETVRAEGASVLLVTHDARVAAHADRRITVRDGQVIEAGAVAL
jgi:putative ABC transport system ATP-binding protein